DTALFTMVTQLNAPAYKDSMELGIQWALDSLPDHIFDTTVATHRMRNIFTGIGYGPNSEVTYLLDRFSILGQGSAKFKNNFGVIVSLDQKDNGMLGGGWVNMISPFKSWWWASADGTYPYMKGTSEVCRDSSVKKNPGALTRLTEMSGNYSSATWDSAY